MDEGKRYEVTQWLVKSQRDLGAVRVLMGGYGRNADTLRYRVSLSR